MQSSDLFRGMHVAAPVFPGTRQARVPGERITLRERAVVKRINVKEVGYDRAMHTRVEYLTGSKRGETANHLTRHLIPWTEYEAEWQARYEDTLRKEISKARAEQESLIRTERRDRLIQLLAGFDISCDAITVYEKREGPEGIRLHGRGVARLTRLIEQVMQATLTRHDFTLDLDDDDDTT